MCCSFYLHFLLPNTDVFRLLRASAIDLRARFQGEINRPSIYLCFAVNYEEVSEERVISSCTSSLQTAT